MKCNLLDLNDYKRLTKEGPDEHFYCITCLKLVMPFTNLSNNELIPLTTKAISIPDEEIQFATPSAQMQKHLQNLANFLKMNITNPSDDDDDDDTNGSTDQTGESPVDCNYYCYDEFNKLKLNSSKSLSIFHLNIHSIQKHIENLRTLLLMLESDSFQFDILAISESKIHTKSPIPKVDIRIENYHEPISMPSEAQKGGVLLYVNKKHHYNVRNDLNVYAPRLLESKFIEIINPKSKNDIIGVLYRHPSMDTETFNDEHFRPLLQKLACENNKNICIAGDFNINLLNVSSHDPSADFIDILTAHNYMPTITLPTKINTSGVHTFSTLTS